MEFSVKGKTIQQIIDSYNVSYMKAWRAEKRGYLIFTSEAAGIHHELHMKDILQIEWINRKKFRKHRTVEDFLYGRSQLKIDLYNSMMSDLDDLRQKVIKAIKSEGEEAVAASEDVISHILVKRFILFPYNMARRKRILPKEEMEFKDILSEMALALSSLG